MANIIPTAEPADFNIDDICLAPNTSPIPEHIAKAALKHNNSSNIGIKIAQQDIIPIAPTEVFTIDILEKIDAIASPTALPTTGTKLPAKYLAVFNDNESAELPTAPCIVNKPTYKVILKLSVQVAILDIDEDIPVKSIDGTIAQIIDIAKNIVVRGIIRL